MNGPGSVRLPRSGSVCLATVALLVLGVPTTGAAQTSWFSLPVQEHVLDNGLKLLVLERPGDHRVAAKIFTRFGAVVEAPGMLGAAHFLEHLMFKGTPTLGTTDWDAERPLMDAIDRADAALNAELNRARRDLQERGVFGDYAHQRSTPTADSLRAEIARLNEEAQQYRLHGAMMRWYQAYGGQKLTATTEQEYMKFDINLPADRVDVFFRIESDRMQNTVFREFDQERMILVEQRYGDLNNPTTPFYEQMNAAAGLVHPVFWPEGYPSDFYQYSRAYLRSLYERYFVPNNTTIVLIGGVTMDQMIPLAERYFGSMERAEEPLRVRAVEPVPGAERRVIYRSNELPPRVEVRYQIPGVGHPDRPLVDVLARAGALAIDAALVDAGLGGTASANTQVVHESRFGVPGTVNYAVVLNNESDLTSAEHIVLQTLNGWRTAVPDSETVARAVKQIRNEWFLTTRDMDRLGFELGHFEVMDSWRTLERYVRERDAATGEDLRALAARYFVANNRTVGVVMRPEGR